MQAMDKEDIALGYSLIELVWSLKKWRKIVNITA